jgi:hypothetical protein
MLPLTAAHAASYSIANMNITSGGFTAYDYLNQPFFNPSSGGSYTPFTIGSNTNLVGGYLGNASSGVVSGLWYNTPANLYTAPSNIGSAFMPAESIQGGPVPGGTLDNVAGTIRMDLSAVFVYWGGADFHQGTGKIDGVTSSFAAGIWDPNTGLYSLSWISNIDPIVCGPLGPTCSATYTLEGYAVASAVPTPAAAYLFGSGLIGLAGFARKHKAAS